MKRLAAVLLLPLLLSVPLAAIASLGQLSNLFVIGDSLSDGGNSGLRTQQFTGDPSVVFPPFPYYNGQYSNGPVAVQYLWDIFNPGNPGGFKPSLAGGTNYAIGGSTSGSENYNAIRTDVPPVINAAFAQYGAAWQMQTFAAQQPVFDPATSLFVVWLFPNDVFYTQQTGALSGVVPGSPGGPDPISNGIANILTIVQTLAAAGAQHFLVPNLPDLGLIPAFLGTPLQPTLSGVSALFNANLAAQLTLLDQALPIEIVQFDTAGAFNAILNDPAAYGFENTTGSCVDNLASGVCNPGNWDRWVFWDGVHPTTSTQHLLATEFAAAVPEPSSLALAALALMIVMGTQTRRFKAASVRLIR
ncbi:MAG: SGNH/GDSL hydrolase family protein [Betaproteobacteria bacterium]